jgi:hypothetical protein
MIEFCADDNDDEESEVVLNELEKIDDECDQYGIKFVKIDDDTAAKEFGIDDTPALVYFENEVPNLYDGEWKIVNPILKHPNKLPHLIILRGIKIEGTY